MRGNRPKKGGATANGTPINGIQCKDSRRVAFKQGSKFLSLRGKGFDFKALNERLKPHLAALVNRLLPQGRRQGHEWIALNPRRSDRQLGSFKINLKTGAWCDFATDDKGGDIISLWAYVRGLKQLEAARELLTILGVRYD